jgi:drug/metabolite transporter (DMT)-like permease
VKLERLTRGHIVAGVGALGLLLVMAMSWYGSHQADQARQIRSQTAPGATAGEVGRAVQQDARTIIARDEKSPWQEEAAIDRVLLGLLLLTIFLPLLAAFLRASGRRSDPPWTPSAFAALCAALTALLVAYRIVQRPGPETATTIRLGPYLALLLLAALGIGAAAAFQKEADFSAMRDAALSSDPPADPPPAPAEQAG